MKKQTFFTLAFALFFTLTLSAENIVPGGLQPDMAAARDIIAQMMTTGRYAGNFNGNQNAWAASGHPNTPAASGEITIMFAYTEKAAIAAGGPAKIKQSVEIGMQNLNAAFANNQIGYTVKAIAEYVEVKHEAAILTHTDVSALLVELGKKDGKFNKVHQLRQQKQADIVCLIYAGHSMGQAQLNGDMMVCHYSNSIFGGTYIFPHEFGHVMGATHEAGMKYPNPGNLSYRTISNNGGVAIPYYSENNRTITYEGKSFLLGDATHDNAGTIRKNAPAKSILGENLPNVPASANADPAKLVNPATAPTPPGEPLYAIHSFSVNDGLITMAYSTSDATEINIEGFDAKGVSFGGFSKKLDPSKTLLIEGFYRLTTGDKVVLTIDGKAVATYTQQ